MTVHGPIHRDQMPQPRAHDADLDLLALSSNSTLLIVALIVAVVILVVGLVYIARLRGKRAAAPIQPRPMPQAPSPLAYGQPGYGTAVPPQGYALLPCTACGNPISPVAAMCPRCGHPRAMQR